MFCITQILDEDMLDVKTLESIIIRKIRNLTLGASEKIIDEHYLKLYKFNSTVVGVVQLVEQQIVVLFVVGSSPIVHPIFLKPVSNNWLFLYQLF